jgi:hypothetical protein
MGFRLIRKANLKTEKGEYFRNNVWWWRRLAEVRLRVQTGVVDDKDKESMELQRRIIHVTAQRGDTDCQTTSVL